MGFIKIYDDLYFPDKFWNEETHRLFPQKLLDLILHLHHKFNEDRLTILSARKERQQRYDRGDVPDYLESSSEAVVGSWQVSPIPRALLSRRVEITGPAHSEKMVIKMLSRNEEGYRADTAMLDFEDSLKPSFQNILSGYKNVIAALAGNLSFQDDKKQYSLNPDDMAYPMVRPRGLHLLESNVRIHKTSVSASLLDLAVCFFHTMGHYLKRGLSPKFYIPKCEHYLEARWWNNVFVELEQKMNVSIGTLKVTFLIETLPAAFQIEEILYEIRDHAVGLNVGRWDKIFSDIKILKNHPDRVLADRSTLTMTKPWMENYAKRVIKICHDRGALAIGGMAAFTPGKTAEAIREQAEKIFLDKKREADWGHDGCWVSHPYFIGVAMGAMNFKNQLSVKHSYDKYPDILPKGGGPYTLEGLRVNIRVGTAYLFGWQKDIGCIALDNLMEDLATLEISRAQIWQWLHHKITLSEGVNVTKELIREEFENQYQLLLKEMMVEMKVDDHKQLENDLKKAKESAFQLFTKEDWTDFFSLASEPV